MNHRRPSSRHLGRLLGLSILLAGMLLAGCLYLLATPPVTGYSSPPPATILPSAWATVTVPQTPSQPVQNAPSASPAPKVTPKPTVKPKPRHEPSVAEAKAYALARLGPTQYACLADIVKHEDGTWDPYRTNSSSGAYGIPQALPGSKMATAGADWRWNRITQVKWMIGYVNRRYGSACQAWVFWQRVHWY